MSLSDEEYRKLAAIPPKRTGRRPGSKTGEAVVNIEKALKSMLNGMSQDEAALSHGVNLQVLSRVMSEIRRTYDPK